MICRHVNVRKILVYRMLLWKKSRPPVDLGHSQLIEEILGANYPDLTVLLTSFGPWWGGALLDKFNSNQRARRIVDVVYEGQLTWVEDWRGQSSRWTWSGSWKRFGTTRLSTANVKMNDVSSWPQITQRISLENLYFYIIDTLNIGIVNKGNSILIQCPIACSSWRHFIQSFCFK